MSGLIDVHILDFQSNPKWLEQAVKSLKHPEINVHVISGDFDFSIGKARAHGFRQGDAPYVSFLDNDDFLPNDNRFIDLCLEILEKDLTISQTYTDYFEVDARTEKILGRTNKPAWNPVDSLANPFTILHWHTLRRSAVMPHLALMAEFPTYEEFVICSLACDCGPAKKVDVVGHYKRTGGVSMRLASQELLRKAVKLVTPSVMKHARKIPDWDDVTLSLAPRSTLSAPRPCGCASPCRSPGNKPAPPAISGSPPAGRLRLGDRLEAALKTAGIRGAVKAIERLTGLDCGCARRTAALNRWLESRRD